MELKIDNASIEKLVQEHIKAAVAGALSQKSDFLIAELVRYAMAEKQNSYDRDTLLDRKISAMIREEAAAAIKEWLDEKRPTIRKQVWAAVSKQSDGLVAKIVEQLVLGLSQKLEVSAYLKNRE